MYYLIYVTEGPPPVFLICEVGWHGMSFPNGNILGELSY